MPAEHRQHGGIRRARGVGGQQGAQLPLAGLELCLLGAELDQARAADVLGHGAAFEGGKVAVDRLSGIALFGPDGGQFAAVVVQVGLAVGVGLGDGLVEEVGALVGARLAPFGGSERVDLTVAGASYAPYAMVAMVPRAKGKGAC